MAHNEPLAALPDQLHQRTRRDSGAHLAAMVGFFISAAVEVEIQTILYYRLVTAAAQSHFDGKGGKFIPLLIAFRIHAQAKGDGGRQAGGTCDLVDLLQKIKLIIDDMLQIPLFKNQQEAVLFQPAQQTAVLRIPKDRFVSDQVGAAFFFG